MMEQTQQMQEMQQQETRPAQQAQHKKQKTPHKSLNTAIPKRGFEYRTPSAQLSKSEENDQHVLKQALALVAPNLHKTAVDAATAELFVEAKKLRDEGCAKKSIFARAGKNVGWSKNLPEHVVVAFMHHLQDGRSLHILLTAMRGTAIDPATEGKLAHAIDGFSGNKPFRDVQPAYVGKTEKWLDQEAGMWAGMKSPLSADDRVKIEGAISIMQNPPKINKANWDAVEPYNDSDEDMEDQTQKTRRERFPMDALFNRNVPGQNLVDRLEREIMGDGDGADDKEVKKALEAFRRLDLDKI